MKTSELTAIYNNYINDLYSYALHLGFDQDIIMDAIHDVFFNLCKTEADLKRINNIKFFLFKSLKNRLLNLERTSIISVGLPLNPELEEMPFNIHISIDNRLITQEEHEITKRKIEQMLNLLTPRQREAVYLRYAQEYDYEQVAQIMNITIPACRKLVHQGLSLIREKYSVPLFFLLLSSLKPEMLKI